MPDTEAAALARTWMMIGWDVPQATLPSVPEISQSWAARSAYSALSWAASGQGTSLPPTEALSAQSPASGRLKCNAYVPSQLSVTFACRRYNTYIE